MGGRQLLSAEKLIKYDNEWENFEYKNDLETEYNVHSSKPAISKVMLYEGYSSPILRSKIKQKKLREVDPYYVCRKYANKFWHIQHYVMLAEQMYHAGSNMIRDNSKLVVKDVIKGFNLNQPIFWQNPSKHVSIELILKENEKKGSFLIREDAFFSFYNERTKDEIGNLHFGTYVNYRSYICDMNTIKNSSDKLEIENTKKSLIRKIEGQYIKHDKLALIPRKNIVSATYLIEKINNNIIPTEELIDFFSLWQPS